MTTILAFLIGLCAGYFGRSLIGKEIDAIHAKVDALIAEVRAKV